VISAIAFFIAFAVACIGAAKARADLLSK